MSDNTLLEQLIRYLPWKESKAFYAKKLHITEEEVVEMLKTLDKRRKENKKDPTSPKRKRSLPFKFDENIEKGTGEITFDSETEIRNIDELIKRCKIDETKWEIIRYVQNYWGNRNDPHWQVKAWLKIKSTEQVYQDKFMDFLSSYTPHVKVDPPETELDKGFGCLIINKQDAHFNRFDIGGKNDIHERFDKVDRKIDIILHQATLSHNIEKIIYILGSDAFNSEFTGATTKGTPQENILSYHESFQLVCDHEVNQITKLLKIGADVHIMFVSGNHDKYEGWHMVNWLKSYFRDEPRLIIDDSPDYRKYSSYGCSAFMFNHGDRAKNAKLAGIFPIEYREHWSENKYFYVFTGDKHLESSENINSIRFYRVAAFTDSRSDWEDHGGMIDVVGEATGFLIDDQYGMTNIFKHYL